MGGRERNGGAKEKRMKGWEEGKMEVGRGAEKEERDERDHPHTLSKSHNLKPQKWSLFTQEPQRYETRYEVRGTEWLLIEMRNMAPDRDGEHGY